MKPKIQVFKNLQELSIAAAELFVHSAAQAIAARGQFLTALSGGGTPRPLYELLARLPYRDQIDWSKVYVFWGDERCVSRDDPGNNYFQAKQALFDHIPLPTDNIHRIASELEPEDAAKDYARVLKDFAESPYEWPRFDLVLLGMGDDGHTASLFPSSQVEAKSATIAVTANYQDRPAKRVSLTPLVFNAARRVVFLAVGKSKSETLASILNGEYHPELLPAQRICPTDGEVLWLVDEAAAGKLSSDLTGFIVT
jgi:6-phosphogluconolactonase